MGTLQFEPSDTYSTTVDVFYSTMKQEDNARSLEINLTGYPAPCCDGTFPDRIGVRIFGHHGQERHYRRRHAE